MKINLADYLAGKRLSLHNQKSGNLFLNVFFHYSDKEYFIQLEINIFPAIIHHVNVGNSFTLTINGRRFS